jgi:hypothetical protein
MKKFSKVKYFGAVAAALLAVAPIAAPVVSRVASPATASAAMVDNDLEALNTTFNSTANSTLPSNLAAAFKGFTTPDTAANATAPGTIGSLFLKGAIDSKIQYLKFTVDGMANYDDAQLQAEFASPKSSYTIKVSSTNQSGSQVLATKTLTLNVKDNSTATIKGSTVKIGDAIGSVVTPSAGANAITLNDRNNNTITINGSDVVSKEWAATAGGDVIDLSQYKFNDGNAAVSLSGSSYYWANPGQVYAVFTLKDAAKATKYNTVNWNYIADNNSQVKVSGDDVLFYQPVTITTGVNDKQYYPVFDYTYSKANADQALKTVTYTDGQTVELNPTDAGSLQFYPATQGTKPSDIASALSTVVSHITYREDSTVDKDGKTKTPTTIDFNATAAVSKTITNLYKAGTYQIPVTVKNAKNFTATVYVPVTIGYAQNAPVAVSFTPYTEITKGASFNKFTGIQFQNSASDTTAIPESSVSVSGDVDTTTPGTYTLTYTVKNSQGNTATFTRTVVVKDGALTESNADGVVYINKADDATVYSDAATTKATDKTLQNTSAWKFHSVVKDATGKIVAYNLGGKQYVKASEVSTSPVKAQAGVFTVHYPANAKWSIAVYNSDLKVVKLIPAKSSWLTFGTKTLKDGKSYYNLGGNQWVRTDYGFWNAK